MPNITATFPIIGYVRSPLRQKFGIPRQPNLVAVPSVIEFLPPFNNPQAFDGIEDFSHLWVLWQFHQNRISDNEHFSAQIRPPRLGGNEKIGVFASRSMYRPSNIGMSVVALDFFNPKTRQLHIIGGDMLDGTPVLDVKPYIAYSDSIATANSGFAPQKPATKTVIISEFAYTKFEQFIHQNSLSKKDIAIIEQLIAQDPRPAYRQVLDNRQFVMQYKDVDITFLQTDNQTLSIINVVKVEN